MKNLRILFFGGTFVNYEISKMCIKLGAKCFFSDRNKDCFVSRNKNFINIDFNDRKKVIKFIRKKKINFLYISQSDVGIRSLGYLNTKLKLPGINYNLAKILTNKVKIRKILTKNGFYQPRFFEVKNKKNSKINFSKKNLLLKPIDSSGSRGIFEIRQNSNLKYLISKSLKFSKSKKLIIEEKISGIEFGAQTFSINGECKHVILHNDFMSTINNKIPVGHAMPFTFIKNKLEKTKIKIIISKAVDVLGVKNGPCNVDCIYTKNNKLVILEISPRVGATCLPQMLNIYTGVDWDLNTIKIHNSLKIEKIRERKIHVVAKVLESKKTGVLKEIVFTKKYKNIKLRFLVKKEQKINKFIDGSKLFGYVISSGKNYKKILNRINLTIKSIKIILK